MSEALTLKIAECRSELDEVDARILMMTAERARIETKLGAFEEALMLVQSEAKSSPRRQPPAASEGLGRKLRQEWADILSHFGKRHPASFNIDDIERHVQGAEYQPTRGNIRSQMAQYAQRDLVERVDDGVFRLTEKGFLAVGLDASALNVAPPPPLPFQPSSPPYVMDAEMLRVIGDDSPDAAVDKVNRDSASHLLQAELEKHGL